MNKGLLAFLIFLSGFALPVQAADELSSGQVLYLPIYSKIFHGDRVIQDKFPLEHLLSALVSIRNTSLKTPIRVYSARYYNTEGRVISEFLSKPVTVAPLGTYEIFIERKESEGGSGANFIIKWDSVTATNPPVVEAVHADISGPRTLSFVTTARSIQIDK
jgi:hypothetical protein